ncbi:MAG: hypothetical protein EPO07_08490 [Verrucomicrobia bacterium]|nr:MAG: hypothetical protein EPO07_08490 [Verrucomicrobiota bacterium]
MAETWKPVKLAAKVIGHISQGMYRTPAGAIKELISNAYDAGATYAKLHTSFPTFATFSCEDDGSGISKTKFIQLMEGGIGDSEKQATAQAQVGKNGRPTVGRLGVGLLSLAQICPRFKIRSFHEPTRTAFEAEIKFPAYSRQEIDRIVEETKENQAKIIKHGEYRYSDISYEKGKHGIIVTTTALRDMFRKTMSNLETFAHSRFWQSSESYPTFERFIDAIANPGLSSLYFASQYDQLLFGLALASPIPYVESDSKGEGLETILLKVPEIASLQKQLKGFDFRVEVDNIELCRPVVLPSNKDRIKAADCIFPRSPRNVTFTLKDGVHEEEVSVDKYDIGVKGRDYLFQIFHFAYSKTVNGYPLQFSGYIFLQTTRLFPKEYQGILIRLRNVAIGQYDSNIMNYPLAEGPRFSMLSSEVFVQHGLDDALKVDRDGFNSLDPQYIRLQAFVHSILHELIFPGSWEEEKARNKQRRETRERETVSTFSTKLKQATKKQFTKIEIVPKAKGQNPAELVQLDKSTGIVEIYESHPEAKHVLGHKKNRGIAARVVAAFEVANREGTVEKRRKIFYELIGEIFNE